MDTLFGLLIIALVWENYTNLYNFLRGKSDKEPYYYKKDSWDWQDFDRDDIL